MSKFKFAMYWAGSCGGCEIAVLEIKEKILEVDRDFDVVFWPVAADFKYKDVEGYDDDSIDLCLFNGCIRNSENEYVAKLLRQKSKVLVAFGACAVMGGIPGLANVADRPGDQGPRLHATTRRVDNPDGVYPQERVQGARGRARAPAHVRHGEDAGADGRRRLLHARLPSRGASDRGGARRRHRRSQGRGRAAAQGRDDRRAPKTCCDECKRARTRRRSAASCGIWEILPDPEKCLLEQGMVCMGPRHARRLRRRAARRVGMPCRGCYGAPEGVSTRAPRCSARWRPSSTHPRPEEIAEIIATVPDPVGTFYRFGLADSLLRRARV